MPLPLQAKLEHLQDQMRSGKFRRVSSQDSLPISNGDPRASVASLPWWQFHVLVAFFQYGFVLSVLTIAQVFANGGAEILGHVGIGSLLVAMGVIHLVHTQKKKWHQALISDGHNLVLGGGLYVALELLTNDYTNVTPWKNFFQWSGHIAFATLNVLVGILGIAIGRARVKALATLPVFLGTLLWLIFVVGHIQPTGFSTVAHAAAGVWIGLGGLATLLGRNYEAGASYILSGYTLFSGQEYLCRWAEDYFSKQTYTLWTHFVGVLVIMSYVLHLIRKGELELPVDEDDDDERQPIPTRLSGHHLLGATDEEAVALTPETIESVVVDADDFDIPPPIA